MKYVKKCGLLIAVLCMAIMFTALQAFAADPILGNVKKLSAKAASESSVSLSWSKVSKATGYYVYSVNSETGALKKVASTKSTKCTISKLKPENAYTFQVFAYLKSKGKTFVSAQPSPAAKATLHIKTPGKPSNLHVASYGNLSILLKWNSASNASGYNIFQYNETTKTFEKIASTKEKSYTVSRLTEGTTYRFVIQSYRSVQGQSAVSKMSNEASGKARSLSGVLSTIHGRWFNVTVRSDTTATVVGTSKKITVKKGTKMISQSRSSKTVTAIMKNNTKIKISGKKLRYNSLNVSKNAFSKTAKEAYINAKGYSSRTKYLIWISQYTLTVNIFKGSAGEWELVRTMPCVVGADGKTSTGTFRLLFKDSAYGGVRIYFTWNAAKQWGNSFHRRVDGNTQAAVSHGCIRLGNGDLSYLNSTCPLGTTVISY